MSKHKFNIYCAGVMGEAFTLLRNTDTMWLWSNPNIEYNPYDDLNQAADVFDKLMSKEDFLLTKWFTYDSEMRRISLPLKEVVREFIMSKMELAQDEQQGD